MTSIEADFACNAYSKHTCKVHVRPSRELVRFKKCFSAFSSNTPGRHCRKKFNFFFFFKQTNSWLGPYTCTLHVCLLYALQAKSAAIDVTKGVGGVHTCSSKQFIKPYNVHLVTNQQWITFTLILHSQIHSSVNFVQVDNPSILVISWPIRIKMLKLGKLFIPEIRW